MNWDDDIDLLAGRKSVPKQGRRAAQPGSPENSELIDNALASIGTTNRTIPDGLVRSRKTGGWADEAVTSAKNRGTTNLIEQERFQERKADSDDDIPIIPDIDDLQDDLLNLQEIKAPAILIKKSTYKELDSDLINVHTTSKFISLTSDVSSQPPFKLQDKYRPLLTKKLYPEKEVKYADNVWTMESLFSELITVNTS